MKIIQETDHDFICDVRLPCFQVLQSEEIELIRGSKTQVLFRKGDNLTKQGAFASYILFVAKGVAVQYVENESLKNYNLKVIQPGEILGLSTLFQNKTFDFTVTALTDCQAILIEKEAVVRLLKQNGNFSFNLLSRYCQQNSNLFDTLRKVLYKQMNGRMADALLYLNEIKQNIPDIFHHLNRKDIADFAGVTPENAVKLLKSFEKDGLIQLSDKDIIIIQKDKLAEISKKG